VHLHEPIQSDPPCPSSLPPTGEGLLRGLHGEADPLHNSPESGIHSPTCVQSQRTSHLRSRHQISASKADCVSTFSSNRGMFHSLLIFMILSFFRSLSRFRWATRWQWSSVWTLRCSCCPRGACGSLTAPWASLRRRTWPFLRVRPSKGFFSFNSVSFIQPNITNYEFASEGFIICTHTTSLTFDLTSDEEKLPKIEKNPFTKDSTCGYRCLYPIVYTDISFNDFC